MSTDIEVTPAPEPKPYSPMGSWPHMVWGDEAPVLTGRTRVIRLEDKNNDEDA